MEPGPSGFRVFPGGGQGSSPVAGPTTRPCLAQPVHVPSRFIVPPEYLLPHQVKSGIDIGNLFKLLNALQNRIAFACGQHQYLRDPLNQPRPEEDGGYKPLTPQAAVRDLRSLCKQQRNLMEKLRRWNCTNEGKCYDIIISGTYTGICANCEPFAASRLRMKQTGKAIRKQNSKAKRKALKKLAALPLKSNKQSSIISKKKAILSPVITPPQPCQVFTPTSKRRKKLWRIEPPHPESFLSQENFLGELGLVTPEVYKKTQAESRRTERRRRTTANPKYKSVGVDPNEVGRCKRSRRSDPSSLELQPSTLSSPSGAERRRAKQKRYECTVCEKKDVTVQCNRCMSGFHPDCIRVTASKASPPTTVPVCPNCVHCNPSIRSSDCILLSRRMLRPSIMSLKADPAPLKSPRTQKATARRKLSAKKYSRRSATSSPAKSPTFRSKIIKKKATQRQSFCKRTLNHSLAVAAAAAVPAYCTTSPSNGECGLQRKRKLEIKSTKHIGSERRVQLVKREIMQTLQPEVGTEKVALDVKKVEIGKAIVQIESSASPEEKESSTKSPPEEASLPKPKKAKLEKLEENIVPAESAQGQSKPVTNKPKKSKPGPVDPFCMKRTMMAMSAAAGLVLSNSGIKMANGSNPPTTSSAVGSQKGGETHQLPSSQGSPQKVPKSNASPLGNLNTKSFEKETKMPTISQTGETGKFLTKSVKVESKLVDSQQQTIPKPAQKIGKQAVSKPPVTNATVSKIKQKSAVASQLAVVKQESSPETNTKQLAKPILTSAAVNLVEKKVAVHPKPAIISNLLALKKKSLEPETFKPVNDVTPPQLKLVKKQPPKQESPQTSPEPKTKKVKTPQKMDPALEQSIIDTIERVVLDASLYSNSCKKDIEDFINTARQFTALPKSSPKTIVTSTSDWAHDDFSVPSNHDDRPASPASNSSTVGSPRSLRDLDSDSDDLLSIPDVPLSASYLELKRLEQPAPFLNLSGIDRYSDYQRDILSPKRGRGRGRGGRH